MIPRWSSRRWFVVLGLFAAVACALPHCGRSGSESDPSELYVVATTGMLADAARNIGGEHVKVDGLMGPGVDPHTYKATSSDTQKLANADLILYNGLDLEGEMGKILKKMDRRTTTTAVAESVAEERLIQPRTDLYVYDPHLWFDVGLWSKALASVRQSLVRVDPEEKEAYNKQYRTYKKKLQKLDDWVTRRIQTIPERRRVLITAHDAFAYFGRGYNLEVRGLQGVSTDSSVGIKDREQLAEFIIDRGITAIFLESSVPARPIQSVIQTCESRGHTVEEGGKLYSDAMGRRGTPEGTYTGMVRHNVNTIVNSLTETSDQTADAQDQ